MNEKQAGETFAGQTPPRLSECRSGGGMFGVNPLWSNTHTEYRRKE
jgi:hypothetical protein